MTGWLAVLGHGYATVDRFCATPLGHVVTLAVCIGIYALFVYGGGPRATFRAIGSVVALIGVFWVRPYLTESQHVPAWLATCAVFAGLLALMCVVGKILTSRTVSRIGAGGDGP